MAEFTSKQEVTSDVYVSTSEVVQPVKLVSDEAFFYMRIVYSFVFGFAVSTLGMTTNIINIIVYCRQGVRDTVNITFIALAVWDLSVSFLSGLTATCTLVDIYFPVPNVKVMSVQYVYIAYTRGCMYVLSTLVTVYLSIERCVCIMSPFKVKEIFTTPRVVLINAIIVMLGTAFICPAWATQGLLWKFDPRSNRTVLTLWVSVDRREVDLFVDTFSGMALPTIAQVLITLSAGFMIHVVRKSARFRNQNKDNQTRTSDNSKTILILSTSDSQKMTTVMTNKDFKLTKVVIMLSSIFFACNFPVFVVAFLRAMIPDLDVGKLQYNLYSLFYGFVYLCGLVNSSVNIFVYYNVSTKYKQDFLRLFQLTTFSRNK